MCDSALGKIRAQALASKSSALCQRGPLKELKLKDLSRSKGKTSRKPNGAQNFKNHKIATFLNLKTLDLV